MHTPIRLSVLFNIITSTVRERNSQLVAPTFASQNVAIRRTRLGRFGFKMLSILRALGNKGHQCKC